MEVAPNIYIGRRISPEWYGAFAERASALMPAGLTFSPISGTGLTYVSANEVERRYAAQGFGNGLEGHLNGKIDELANSGGPRTSLKRFSTRMYGFRFEEIGGEYLLKASINDELRRDGKWRVGEEEKAFKVRFLKLGRGNALESANGYTACIPLGYVRSSGELPHFSVLKQAVRGKLLDETDARTVFQRVSAVVVDAAIE